jgi:predicted PurR-regulated permease PerM
MTRVFNALCVIATVFLLGAASSASAATLLAPGTYAIGPASQAMSGTLTQEIEFQTNVGTSMGLHLHADLNGPVDTPHQFLKIVIQQVDAITLAATDLFTQTLSFVGSLDLDIPTAVANLGPSPAGTFYLLKVAARLGANGGGFDGTFTLSAVPIPQAALLFGTALVALVGFARRRQQTV